MYLIDADITCFSSTAACQVETEWDEDTWSMYFDFARAKVKFQAWLDKVLDQLEPGDFTLCYTGRDNFRKKVCPTYKAKRGPKPVGYGALKDWSKENYPFFEKDALEADDVMGILATARKNHYPVTMDKDLLTIPGRMFHLNQKLEGEWVDSNEKEGTYQFLLQTLMGDNTDGYTGCPGMGKVGAAKWLDTKGATWSSVVEAYKKAKLTEEDALMNARCARILRASDWDFKTEQVKLWTP